MFITRLRLCPSLRNDLGKSIRYLPSSLRVSNYIPAFQCSAKRFYDVVNMEHLKNEGIQLKSQHIGISNHLGTVKHSQVLDNDIHSENIQQNNILTEKDCKTLNKEQILFKLFKTSTTVTQFYDLISVLLERNESLQTYEINEIMKQMVNRNLYRLTLYIYDKYHTNPEFNETSYIYLLKAINEGGYNMKLKEVWNEINSRVLNKSESLICAYLECIFHYNDLQSAIYIYSLIDIKKKYISPHLCASILKGICDGGRYYECIYMFEKMECEGSSLNEISYASYIHSLFKLNQYEKCIAIYADMKNNGLTPNAQIYIDMITIYDKSNIYGDVYEEALSMAQDIHVHLDPSLQSRLLRYISDEQKEQGLWLLREMINITKYSIPEINKNGDIYIDYTTIPSSVSRFSLLSLLNKLKKKYSGSMTSTNGNINNSKRFSVPLKYPSLYITTNNDSKNVTDITRLLKEDLKPSIEYTEENGIISVSSSVLQQWLTTFSRYKN